MIEKYVKRKITRKDLEKRMLEGSLQGEYNKYYKTKTENDTLIKVKIDGVFNTEMKKEEEIKIKETPTEN
jgi:penicillin-binding protein 2